MGKTKEVQDEGKQRWFGLRGKKLTTWITVACATDMALFGYDQGLFSGVILCQDYLDVMGFNDPSMSEIKSLVTSIYAIGCFFGAIAAFSLGNVLGRKKSILIGAGIMTIGAILQATAFSLSHMFVGRIVAGIGNGINTATAPVWQTETSSATNRGKLVVLEMTLNIVGFCCVNWINYGLSYAGGAIAWRLPIALQLVLIIVLFLTVPWLPESPRWLISRDRSDEAAVILADLQDTDIHDERVKAERMSIEYSVRFERENSERWRDILRGHKGAGTKSLRRILLGVGTQAMQQFGGINVLSYYLPTLLEDSVGLSTKMSQLIASCASVIYLFGAAAAAPMVDRFGRRTMMIVSTAIELFCFLCITIVLYYADKPNWDGSLKAAEASVVFFFISYIGFGLGMLGIPWLYPTEINSLPMRSKGASAATMTNWLTNFVVVEITPLGVQNLAWKFYIVWACTNAAFLPILYFFYPETAGRELEDLDAYYRQNPGPIVVGDPDATSRIRPVKYSDMETGDVTTRKNAEREHAAHFEHVG